MNQENLHQGLLGTAGNIFLIVYVASLILIGFWAKASRKENTMSDFYLGGRTLGFYVLFLTLFATQYSGNSLIGMTAKAYRSGFWSLVMVTFMMGVIGVYLIFAPKLQRLSREHSFITLGDFIQFRFKSRKLTLLVSTLALVALANYILSNLKAIGYVVEQASGGAIPFAQGVILLALVMVVYETLGGMRSVAWTDAIQGIMLLIGCIGLAFVAWFVYGGIEVASNIVVSKEPDFLSPPSFTEKINWLSTLLLISLGIGIYPHAIQRIYAAKDVKVLKKSLQFMVFLPLVTLLVMIIFGIIGRSIFPDLDQGESERVFLYLLYDLIEKVPGTRFFVIIFISAAVAAIMSTIDSALLAISSSLAQDFYKPFFSNAPEKHLTMFGKYCSWLVMGLMAYLAIYLPQTIWRLIEIKFEILCQLLPALFLGLHSKTVEVKSITIGLLVGLASSLILIFSAELGLNLSSKPLGIHAGIWGLMLNFLIVFFLMRKKQISFKNQTAS